ncbi:hypothetical protein Y032_0124g1242 [Ancylostoma ceylanicum]|nr:hypothetical protein Y032_0124g1242 [Ancylostoma ceylanicum]
MFFKQTTAPAFMFIKQSSLCCHCERSANHISASKKYHTCGEKTSNRHAVGWRRSYAHSFSRLNIFRMFILSRV